jgi:hypothetical protein
MKAVDYFQGEIKEMNEKYVLVYGQMSAIDVMLGAKQRTKLLDSVEDLRKKLDKLLLTVVESHKRGQIQAGTMAKITGPIFELQAKLDAIHECREPLIAGHMKWQQCRDLLAAEQREMREIFEDEARAPL